jgi:CheY-like chemotaxis protein
VNLPLALLLYEDLLPGTQLVNRLQDLGYRVQVVAHPAELPAVAAGAGAMFLLADLVSKRADICEQIRLLRATPATAHLPIIAFVDDAETQLQVDGTTAGATLVVTDAAIVTHLHQLIEQALQVE